MYATPTPEQRELRAQVAATLATACTPARLRAAWIDRSVAHALWAEAVELGLIGLMVPGEAGGLGLDARDAVLLAEEAGFVGLPGPLADTAWVIAPLLAAAGQTEVLETVISGACWAVSCARINAATIPQSTEPPTPILPHAWGRCPNGAEGDCTTESTAQKTNESTPHALFPLLADAEPGSLILALQGDHAQLYRAEASELTALAGVDPGRPPARFSPTSAPIWTGTGGNAAFDRGALGAAAQLMGLGRRMMALALDYAKVREQFGRPIGSYQAVQHHLANAAVAAAFAEPLVLRAAHSLATGHPDTSVHVSMAHLRAAAAVEKAGRVSLQVFGAIGYTTEHDLHLYLKRAWSLSRAWGDEEFHRSRVAAGLDARSDTKETWDV